MCVQHKCTCADLEGGGSGGSGPSLEFAKLNIADITGNACTDLEAGSGGSGPPLEKFSGSAPDVSLLACILIVYCCYTQCTTIGTSNACNPKCIGTLA